MILIIHSAVQWRLKERILNFSLQVILMIYIYIEIALCNEGKLRVEVHAHENLSWPSEVMRQLFFNSVSFDIND